MPPLLLPLPFFLFPSAEEKEASGGSSFSSWTEEDAETDGETEEGGELLLLLCFDFPTVAAEGTGAATSTAPWPSLPPRAAPHVQRDPSSVTAAEWNLAAATWTTLRSTTREVAEEELEGGDFSTSSAAPRSAGTRAGRASPPPVARGLPRAK